MKLDQFNTEAINDNEMKTYIGGCNNKKINELLIDMYYSKDSEDETKLLNEIDTLLKKCSF